MPKVNENTVVTIYERIVSDISSRYKNLIFENPKTIEQCCIGLSMSMLDNLSSEEFASVAYYKLLDRPASSADISRVASRLRNGYSTKKEEIEKIFKSPEYNIKNINVRMVK